MLSQIRVTGDAPPLQLPGGQPRPLEQRPGLVGEDADGLALLVGGEDHGQGRAVVGGGQAAGVAVGQDPLPRLDQAGAVAADRAAHRPVFLVDRVGLGQQPVEERRGLVVIGRAPRRRSIRSRAQNRLTAVGRLVRR